MKKMVGRILAVISFALALFLVGSAAYADDSGLVSVTTPLGLLGVALVAVVIPFVVDLVTKKFAASGVKSAVLLALTLITGLVTEWINAVNAGHTYDWETGLTTAVLTFLLSVGVFFGFTKPTGLTGADGVLATKGGIGTIDNMKVAKAVEYGKLPPDAAPAAAEGDAP